MKLAQCLPLLLALSLLLLTTTCKKKSHDDPVDDYPIAIDEYIATNYPHTYITEIELDDGEEYEVELCDGTELTFDLEGDFLEAEEDDDDDKENNCRASRALTNIDLSLTMSIEEEVIDSLVAVGDEFYYSLKLKNNGPGIATGVEVYNKPPSQVQWGGFASSQGTWSNGTGIWQIGTLKPQQEVELNITVRVLESGNIEFTSSVFKANQKDIDSTPNNNVPEEDDQASLLIQVQGLSDLSVSIQSDALTANIEDEIAYSLTLMNDGPNKATNITLMTPLPEQLEYVSSLIGGDNLYDPETGTWTIPSLEVGGVVLLELVGRVVIADSILLTAQVIEVDQSDPDSTPSNNLLSEDDQASIFVDARPIVDLSLEKTADVSEVIIGEPITYKITVTNDGPSDATGVQIFDPLPFSLDFVSSTGYYLPSTGIWEIGDLSVGKTREIRITVITREAIITNNIAQVVAADQKDVDSTSGNFDPNEDDQDNALVEVREAADLSLTLSIENELPSKIGDVFTYLVKLQNHGPNTATNIEVQDIVPTSLKYLSSVSSSGFYLYNNGIWTIEELPKGELTDLRINVEVQEVGTITNIAQVFQVDQFDPDSSPNNNMLEEDDQDQVEIIITE